MNVNRIGHPGDSTNANRTVLERVVAGLSDAVLGLLALLAAELALAPGLFDLPTVVIQVLNTLQWLVVGLFAVEYACSLTLSKHRMRFILDPWRLLDLVIIIVPVISLMPSVSNALRSAPVLRLLRVVRLASLAARFSGSVVREGTTRQLSSASAVPEIVLVKFQGELRPQKSTWSEFVQSTSRPAANWWHLSNVSGEYLDAIAQVEGLSRPLLESSLSQANYPRLELSRQSVVLSLWVPTRRSGAPREFERYSVLLVANPTGLMTVAPHAMDVPSVLLDRLPRELSPTRSLPAQLILALLRLVLDRYEEVAGTLEQELRGLEDVPIHQSQPVFFERAFCLRKELSATKSDLWRIKGILSALSEGRVPLPDRKRGEDAEELRVLCDRADYIYQTADNLREGLTSVIELHLNVVSFEMNKFMRLLAVVSVLGLVPAVVGGLLGMNLIGNPWPLTLSQVSYGVISVVLLVVYWFLVRGWLR